MQDICNYHLKQQGLPKAAAAFLEGNVVLNVLEIEAALQDMHVHQLDRDVQAGFFYEGSIYIELDGVKWSGYMCIEVRLGAFQFIGMMSPLSWAPENKTFFSLARSSLVAADYGVPAPKGVVDEDMRLNGPVVFISTKHKAMPLFVSAHLVLLGLDFQVQAVGKPSGFWADLACTFKVTMFGLVDTTASLAGSACVMPANKKESASFSLDIGLALDLPLPNYLAQCVGKVVSVFSASAPPVGVHVSVHFAVAIGPGGANFTFVLAGKLYACGLLFTLPAIEEGLRRDEMDTPDMVIAQIVGQFMSGFPKWLPEALGTDVDKITAFATEQLTFGGTDLVTTVSHFSGKGPAEIIETLGKDKLALHSSADAVAMLQDFGTPAGPAMTIAKRMFGDDEPAPAPAVESKQLTLLEKITLVLWKVKAVGLADGGTQSVQDEGPGQAQNVQNMTLITAALRVYPMGEVIEAANEMFGDLPPELLDAYFEIAQEIIADEQAALALEENATERENTAMRADDAAGLEAKSSVDTVVAVVKIV
ncbi:hypothetical protein DFH27DRAFT_283252 [Peziza echinospora]|nr:hypothetical protein DFH27DRAFT_283252 [Peziza echinospora]